MDKSLVMDGKKKLLATHIIRESMLYPSPSLCIVPTLHRLITTCKQLMYIMNFVRSHSKQTGMHEHKMIKTNIGI